MSGDGDEIRIGDRVVWVGPRHGMGIGTVKATSGSGNDCCCRVLLDSAQDDIVVRAGDLCKLGHDDSETNTKGSR